jgi:dTDP-4-dehydrorhamnose 3,5-epimerase
MTTSSLPTFELATEQQLALQDYAGKPTIDGVKILPLTYFTDDGGYFLELTRVQDSVWKEFPDFKLAQMNYSEMDPAVIKAWHIHKHQEDIWFVPPSHKLLVALKDVRDNSPTKGTLLRLTLGAGKAYLVHIPRGVAHGAANCWQKPAAIIYFVNNHFSPDPASSDEFRLPYDAFGTELWELTKG